MKSQLKHLLICAGTAFIAATTERAEAIPVTFRIDMSGAAGFNAITDVVDVRGTFNGWSGGSILVPTANTNILTNTFEVADAPGTAEYYKFTRNGNYELPGAGDRPFTLAAGAQVLPLVYFNNVPPAVPATTNSITFRVSLATQVTLGNFDPTNDAVAVAGTFQRPSQWDASTMILTNAGANLYIGTYTNDGNYEGTYEEFKFIIKHSGNDNWEFINNRSFILTNQGVLPIVYFNDIGNAVPVTFQVDMGVQAAAGRFSNGAGVVECKGSFNGWLGGFVLTNNPAAVNSNLFSGTTFIFDNPGTAEFYRFTVNGGFSGLGWETPGSTGGDNRSFILPGTALTLPAVLWSDWTAADVLASNTVVTFTVNMTNAVGTDSYVFTPGSDGVYLNGDWIPWWSWGAFPSSYQLTNNPIGSRVYSLDVTFPKGYAVPLSYKYGINSGDNEAGFLTNHVRYIRALGSYKLPMDTFGNQTHEQSFGNLTVSAAASGSVPVSWLGRPGVRLQTATNLASPIIWQEQPATDGLSSTNYPASGSTLFFRLVKP